MRFSKHYQVYKAAASTAKASKYAIAAVYLDTKAKRLVATDGRMLASVPVIPEKDDTTGLIACETVKAACQGAVNGEAALSRTDQRTVVKTAWGILHATPPDGIFPPYGEYVSQRSDIKVSVTLDVNLLKRLSVALGSNVVTLCIGAPNSPIRVIPLDYADAVGAIMPASLNA